MKPIVSVITILTPSFNLPFSEVLKSRVVESRVEKSYKSLWEVEHAFRTLKDVLATRPIFHRKGSHVKGHVFCSYRFAHYKSGTLSFDSFAQASESTQH